MGGGSTDSASTRSPDTSEQMDTRDEEADQTDQQDRVDEYAEKASDDGRSSAGSSPTDTESDVAATAGGGSDGSFPSFEEFLEGDAELPDDQGLPGGEDEEDALAELSVTSEDDLDDLLADEQPRTYSDQAALEGAAVDGAAEADTPAEFSRAVLTDGAIANRYREDGGPPGSVDGSDGASPPAEPGTHRYGGWSDYDSTAASRFRLLPEVEDTLGRTSRYMELGVLSGASEIGTDSAYVTHYDDSFRSTIDEESPDRYFAHREMIGYAFTDAVGARVPPHTFNKAENWVAVGGVDADPVTKLSADQAVEIDREEFVDQMVVQLLAGNSDLNTANVFIGDDGSVHCVDMDMAGHELDSHRQVETAATRVTMTADRIDEKRPDGEKLDVSAEEIADRAQEIAVSLHISGQKERVYDTLESYDQIFDDYYSPARPNGPYGERIKQNIEGLINSARG